MLSPDFVLSSSGFPDRGFFELIQRIGKPKKIAKGRKIVRAGSPSSFLFYIKTGVFKTIFHTSQKDYILAFTFADDIDCCPTTLLNRSVNNFDIEAVVDSEVLICEFDQIKKTIGQDEHLTLVSKVLEHYAVFLEKQLIESLSMTAEERYRNLIRQQPDKIKQIPVSLIASYLGITVERMSRIRKKMR